MTLIDRIVLGLSSINLEAQLQTSTAEIDKPGLNGRTPLHWAILLPDTVALATLLEYGARMDVADIIGRPPLYYAAYFGDLQAFEILIAAITHRQRRLSDREIQATTLEVSSPDKSLKCF